MKLFTRSVLTAMVAFLVAQGGIAQTVNSGAWQLGGSIGFNSIKADGDDASETYFNLSPNVGYYIMNNLGIGVRLSLLTQSYDGESESTFGFGPWARLYVISGLYAQAGIDFGPSAFEIFSSLQEEGGTNLHFGAGYSWFLNNSIAIEPQLEYNIYSGDEDGFIGDYNRLAFTIGIQAFLGRNSE
jgi:outer membrane protein